VSNDKSNSTQSRPIQSLETCLDFHVRQFYARKFHELNYSMSWHKTFFYNYSF